MKTVKWRVHFSSSPELVFWHLTTPEGREKFWAEKADENNGYILFKFPNGLEYESEILVVEEYKKFQIDYFNFLVEFQLKQSHKLGTDLTMINESIADQEFLEVRAGWVSVLLNMKAVIAFNCDLRNHDVNRTWDNKYVDN